MFLKIRPLLSLLLIKKTLWLNNLNTVAMNERISVFVICVEAIIYLLYNLHDCTFKIIFIFQKLVGVIKMRPAYGELHQKIVLEYYTVLQWKSVHIPSPKFSDAKSYGWKWKSTVQWLIDQVTPWARIQNWTVFWLQNKLHNE